MRPNHVKRAWKEGKQTVGGWISSDSIHVAETMARTGFDWLCIDMQHGLLDYNDVRRMLPAISTTDTMPFVRVPWNEPYIIMKVLDAGAYGVIVPLVNNREEAEKAVCCLPVSSGWHKVLWSGTGRNVWREELCQIRQ